MAAPRRRRIIIVHWDIPMVMMLSSRLWLWTGQAPTGPATPQGRREAGPEAGGPARGRSRVAATARDEAAATRKVALGTDSEAGPVCSVRRRPGRGRRRLVRRVMQGPPARVQAGLRRRLQTAPERRTAHSTFPPAAASRRQGQCRSNAAGATSSKSGPGSEAFGDEWMLCPQQDTGWHPGKLYFRPPFCYMLGGHSYVSPVGAALCSMAQDPRYGLVRDSEA